VFPASWASNKAYWRLSVNFQLLAALVCLE
jgi:hypothetical protein